MKVSDSTWNIKHTSLVYSIKIKTLPLRTFGRRCVDATQVRRCSLSSAGRASVRYLGSFDVRIQEMANRDFHTLKYKDIEYENVE